MMRRSITVPDDLDRSVLDLRAFFMKVLGKDLDYTHALAFLARLGFDELAQSEFGPRSMELLERELPMEPALKESLPGDWKKWRAGSVGAERSTVAVSKERGQGKATRSNNVREVRPMIIGYCTSRKCRTMREMKDAQEAVFKNGAKGYRGICSVCGSKMIKIGI